MSKIKANWDRVCLYQQVSLINNIFEGASIQSICSKMHLEHPHIRINPMTGQSVLVSPHRYQRLRPWWDQVEPEHSTDVPEFDASNPLCLGAVRISGEVAITTRLLLHFGFNQHTIIISYSCSLLSLSAIPSTKQRTFSTTIFRP